MLLPRLYIMPDIVYTVCLPLIIEGREKKEKGQNWEAFSQEVK